MSLAMKPKTVWNQRNCHDVLARTGSYQGLSSVFNVYTAFRT